MPRTANQRRPQQRPTARGAAISHAPIARSYEWLAWFALALSASIVIARLTMLEALRNALLVTPGSPPVPVGPGPTTGLVLDLFACVPALLVLLRRWLDPTFALRVNWSYVPMALLAAWAVLSTRWADDKFAALVGSSHWLAASALLWSTSQLVRSWLHVRLVVGICYGLLLVLVVHGFFYRGIEQPALREEWDKNRATFLRQRGFEPGSFEAGQFEGKVLHGELMGFSASPNTHAAVLVLLGAISMGVVAQRLSERNVAGAALVAGGVALSLATIYWTQSRTAYATIVLAVLLLFLVGRSRSLLARRASAVYWLVVACVALGAAAAVGHGMHHGTLFHDSLNFRWRYWVGAFGVFRDHPLLGVGWENFGPHYLASRLPTATEEIKDPHNFVVRFFVELGVVGGVLALVWFLRLWWEMTRPVAPPALANEPNARTGTGGLVALACAATFGVLINAFASIDFTQDGGYVTVELFRRALWLVALLVGMAAVCLRRRGEDGHVELDDDPAPWVLHGLLVGLGLFLLHNTIDFALFEPGPMFAFSLLTGAVLGVRRPDAARTEPTPRRPRRTLVALCAGATAWLAAAVLLVARVGTAEETAQDADRLLAGNRPREAAARLDAAFASLPTNADYAFRAAHAHRYAGQHDRGRAMLDAAVAAAPRSAGYRATRAEWERERPTPDAPRVREDFERALAIDPNNVILRVRYADALESFGQRSEAAQQIERALWFDDQLPGYEKKRLPKPRADELRTKAAALRQPDTRPATRP